MHGGTCKIEPASGTGGKRTCNPGIYCGGMDHPEGMINLWKFKVTVGRGGGGDRRLGCTGVSRRGGVRRADD